jgi:hypothetical protein
MLMGLPRNKSAEKELNSVLPVVGVTAAGRTWDGSSPNPAGAVLQRSRKIRGLFRDV